ncbi:MAG TPA: S49 family peptidase, partial [Candidatus Hodarchaeales archaeon]|nr:S49 family peptidase [Candidatus Hodarchaeales archaeon]
SVPGRKIVSQPGTLTGSIGLVGGKVSFEGVLEKTGIGVVQIAKGERAKWSAVKGFTEEEKEVFKRQIDEIYSHFLSLVKDARKISLDDLRNKFAGGRVWTGRQAKEHGLLDDLGSLDMALKLARAEAKIPEDSPAEIVYPRGGPSILPFLSDPSNLISDLWTDFERLRKFRLLVILDIYPSIAE